MEIIKICNLGLDDRINQVAEEMKKNRTVVFPTDTVYGLLADASSRLAVEKVFRIKQRPKNKPLPIFVANLNEAEKLAEINKKQREFLNKVWPGQVTVVLKKKKGIKIYGSDDQTIALRIPDYRPVRLLLEKVGRPLVGTSANISGKPVGSKIKDIIGQFSEKEPDMIVDAGELKSSRPSTVVDLTGPKVKILRK